MATIFSAGTPGLDIVDIIEYITTTRFENFKIVLNFCP